MIIALTVAMVGNGLVVTVLGVRSSRAGFSAGVTGAVLAGYFVGFLGGARAAGALARRFGLHRTLAGVIALTAAACVAPAIAENPALWIGARVVQGFGVSASYVVVETWLNAATTNDRRGRLLGIYTVSVMAAFALGALLIKFTGADGSWPFVLSGVLTLTAALALIGIHPIAATARSAASHMSLRQLFAMAPIGVVVAVMAGVVNGAFSSISVYAAKAGFSDSRTGWFSALSRLGPILIVFPVGALSDRFRRTRVLTAVAAMAGVLFLLAWMLPVGSLGAGLTLMVAGGLTIALYTMASVETNDHLTPSQIAAASQWVVLMYGIGAIIGPFAVTGGMAAGGAAAYFWVVAIAHGLTVVLVVSLGRFGQRNARAVSPNARANSRFPRRNA